MNADADVSMSSQRCGTCIQPRSPPRHVKTIVRDDAVISSSEVLEEGVGIVSWSLVRELYFRGWSSSDVAEQGSVWCRRNGV